MVSSAQIPILDRTSSGRSLIKTRNKVGPKTDPRGTPSLVIFIIIIFFPIYLYLVKIHKNSFRVLNKRNHITHIEMTKLLIKTKKHNYDDIIINKISNSVCMQVYVSERKMETNIFGVCSGVCGSIVYGVW